MILLIGLAITIGLFYFIYKQISNLNILIEKIFNIISKNINIIKKNGKVLEEVMEEYTEHQENSNFDPIHFINKIISPSDKNEEEHDDINNIDNEINNTKNYINEEEN